MSRIATIDIGTNSVLLTIVELDKNSSSHPLVISEKCSITRLGQDLAKTGQFHPDAIERTLAVLSDYVAQCRQNDVEQIIAVGTAACRMAHNASDFLERAQQKLDLKIEVISGQREAELSFLAASHDFGTDSLVIDIGGGSTEFIYCTENDGWHERKFSESEPLSSSGGRKFSRGDRTRHNIKALSLNLGSVLFTERFVHSDPINDADFSLLQMTIQSELMSAHGSRYGGGAGLLNQDPPNQLIALAGTATTLAAMEKELIDYSHADVHGTVLTSEQISHQINQLKELTIEQRKQLPGLEPKRADVILAGALILKETMDLFGYETVKISDRGVRWGLIYERQQDT